MPRVARRVFPGLPHHIVQRGNRREDVFFSNADRLIYLRWLREYCAFYRVDVLAYCLMTNHVHAVAIPSHEAAFEDLFRSLHTRYAMRVNRVLGSSGHVWQGRFFSSVLDESYLYAAVRYVERNPVRAGMVANAADYRWSSAQAHCGSRRDLLLAAVEPWLPDIAGPSEWSDWLGDNDRPDQLAFLRQSIRRSLPCGNDGFVSELERKVGQSLRPAKMGRPRKVAAE